MSLRVLPHGITRQSSGSAQKAAQSAHLYVRAIGSVMRLFTDWKFAASFIVAIASVAVPIWLWQADLSSKSLAIALTTRVPLQPTEKEALQGLEVSVDGKRIENPYLVVLEISNDGSKPILASDFESPLQIHVTSDTYFVRSRITHKTPKDVDMDITAEKSKVLLKPALLNPKDSVTLTLVTAGAAPSLDTRARIAGIASIGIADNTIKKRNTSRLILLAVAAVLLSIASSVAYDGAFSKKGIVLRQRAAAFIAFVSAMPSVIALMTFLEEFDITGFGYFMLYYTLLLIPTGFAASALNRKETEPPKVGSGT